MNQNRQIRPRKNSGVSWIGEIPNHWQVLLVKRVASVFIPQRNKPELNEDSGYPWITLEEIGGKFVEKSNKSLFVSESAIQAAGSKVLQSGAVVTGCVGTFGTASITKSDLVINQQLQAYIPKKINAEFLRFCILNSSVYFESIATSTTISYVNSEAFAALPIPLPPVQEQKAIASFLDSKTYAIDALIAKKQRLIELLEEKRSVLISQAVTQGLNPNAPMKDSGIPWIGEIPQHWEVRQLKYLCVLQRGFDLPSQEREEGIFPIYGGGGITGYHSKPMIQPPGVVTGRYGTVGEVYLVEEPFWPLNTSLYVKEFWGNSPTFVRYVLSTVAIKTYSAKSAVPGVDRNDLHIIPVAVPPKEEQDLISNYIHKLFESNQKLVQKITTQIEKLQEYRQSLITAAVTGKLDIAQEQVAV